MQLFWVTSWTSYFFSSSAVFCCCCCCCFNWQTDYLDLYIWQILSCKQTKLITSRTKLTIVVVNDKSLTLQQTWEFQRTCFCYHELNSFAVFLMTLVVILPNMISKDCIIKLVNVWKIYTTQRTSVFQMVILWC